LIAIALVISTPLLAQLPFPLPFPPLPMPQGSPEERAACAPDVHTTARPLCAYDAGPRLPAG
jgi:hypothetical protein